MLKMKSVYTRTMVFFMVNFEHALKMAMRMNFLCKNCVKTNLKMKSANNGTMIFFFLWLIFNILKNF